MAYRSSHNVFPKRIESCFLLIRLHWRKNTEKMDIKYSVGGIKHPNSHISSTLKCHPYAGTASNQKAHSYTFSGAAQGSEPSGQKLNLSSEI